MPIPVWVLLGFAAWTLFILFVTVSEWYRRAVRAHLNCLETLQWLPGLRLSGPRSSPVYQSREVNGFFT
jgi:hypothetical protein